MRYTIMGFNQKKLLQYDLNMNEVLLLDYIYNAVASPTMVHKINNEIFYVWLNHKKILEDLPILNIGEDRLKRLIKHLDDLHLIQSIRDLHGKGSKSYYCITKECEELRYSNDEVLKTTLHKDLRGVKNNTSDNKLLNILDNNKSIINNTVQSEDFEFGKKKKSKPNMYDKCVSLINEFTDDAILREMLIKSLQLFIENTRESGNVFYTNNFKGKLSTLKKLTSDNYQQRDIVKQTLDNGWNNFYALKSNSKSVESTKINSVSYYDDKEYIKENERKLAERKKNGQRTKF